jgi:hypothetical protein
MIGIGALPIRADALAVTGTNTPCLLLLEPTNTGLLVNNNAELDASVCGVHVNSRHSQAVSVNGGTVRSESLCVGGGTYKNPSGQFIPAARTGCAPIADPLATLAAPSISGGCESKTAGSGQTITLIKDRCYTDVIANSGGRIVFEPGTYRITGKVIGNADASITGSGVTLYLDGANAQVVANSEVNLELSAPTTGPYAGIVLFQNRSSGSAQGLIVNSDVTGKIEGVVYMPHTTFVLNSDVSLTASYTIFIGRTMTMNSRSKLTLKDRYDGAIPLPTSLLSVRLDE